MQKMREERKSDAAHLYRSAGTINLSMEAASTNQSARRRVESRCLLDCIELAHRPQKETYFARPLALGPGALHLAAFEMRIQIHR